MNRTEYMAADKLTGGIYDGSKGHDVHTAYFAQFVNEGITQTVLRGIGSDKLLASRDVHLNDIPLKLWDALPRSAHIAAKAAALGDNTSQSTFTCVHKTAARLWLKANGGASLWRVRYRYKNDRPDEAHDLYSYAVGLDPDDALRNFERVYSDMIAGEIIDNGGTPLAEKVHP